MVNQKVRGTLYRIICMDHPNVTYTEADLSHYNRFAYTYENMIKELYIDVPALYYGPLVMVMHDQSGMAFRTEEDPDKLLKVVDEYLHNWEKQIYGHTNPVSECDDKPVADNHYSKSTPWSVLDMYEPGQDETHHAIKLDKTVSTHEKSGAAPPAQPAPQSAPPPEPQPQYQPQTQSQPQQSEPVKKKYKLQEPEKAFIGR